MSNEIQIILYTDEKDRNYVSEFILSLNVKTQSKFYSILNLLKEKGKTLKEPYVKHLEQGIHEIRVRFSNENIRVLYFWDTDNRIVLTNGFLKKMQKIKRSEIELAIKRRQDYHRRYLT